ncbi:MAG: hypothetical protein BGO88_14840 [Flavobacterium sp. 38-13]|uniref:DUF7619 domain-containing protein n=1 Tax=Flavobacterium sp. 38-13 TaxID=1896168 RepID=UPI000967FD07|nr:T9SS type A sorting domain-containing protein [Flavobacterium sp. 38-13]OJX49515.1 MAG: hypothetical protein BGO88_14840 [Flavobacterium sp. 38-13]
MKRLLLYGLLFLYGFSYAQNVDILDPSFKSKLLAADVSNRIAKDGNGTPIRIDLNNDGEIQLSEAVRVVELNVSASDISSLQGINHFSNLKILECYHNSINELNLSNNPYLEYVDCSENQISSLNLNGLVNLKHLDCRVMGSGNLTSLNLTGLTALRVLRCGRNSLTTLDLSPVTNLIELDCSVTGLTSLNLNGLVNLKSLDCSLSQLSTLNLASLGNLERLDYSYNPGLASLNISSLTSLKELSCNAMGLTSLNLSSFLELVSLSCHSNILTNLDFSANSHLERIECSANQLTALNVAGLPSLTTLMCSYNQFSVLNLSGLENLSHLDCRNNNIVIIETAGLNGLISVFCNNNSLTKLDLSHSPYVSVVSCADNPQLISVNLKNGFSLPQIFDGFDFANTPNLEYVCADEDELALFQSFFTGQGMNVSVTPYCTFTPGGDYNTIAGMLRLDENGNGCDTNDRTQPFIKVKINDGIEESSVFTDLETGYAFYMQSGAFTLTPATENTSFFSFSPASTVVNFPNNNNNTQTQNFCITPNGVHSDIEIAIAPVVPARPGFDAVYKVVYKNNGNQTVSQNAGITLRYNQDLMSFVSSTPVAGSQTPGRITWGYTDLHPFESRSFTVTMNINRPTDGHPVNINDILSFNASITAPGDENTNDNTFTLRQKVVGSFDPNDISCLEGDIVPPTEIGEYLHYLVRFENTGNAPAQNIVIRNEIDEEEYDVSSLQILDSSHKLRARVKGNRAEFIFQNVYLDSGGHGNILLKLKSTENLVAESTVSSRVGIYFDYNTPVLTNRVTTVFKMLSVGEKDLDQTIKIYPNPVNKMLNIKAAGMIRTVYLYDAQGRILMTQLLGKNEVSFDLSNYAAGVYFVKIITDEGAKTEKIINRKN